MDIKKQILMVLCCYASFQHSENTYAAPTKECFKTDYDYEVFTTYGNETPPKYGIEGNSTFSLWYGAENFTKMKKAGEHGPAQRKPVVINLKDITVSGKDYIDAIDSTTPSGKADYKWHNRDYSFVIPASKLGYDTVAPGGKLEMTISVTDPICDVKVSKTITLTGR